MHRNLVEGPPLKSLSELKTYISNKEIADGTIYDSPLTTSWRAPTWILDKGKDYWNRVRSKMKIIGIGKKVCFLSYVNYP